MNRLSLLKRLSSGISLATCLIFLSSFSAKSERHSPDLVQCAGDSGVFQLPALHPNAATRPITHAKASEKMSHFLELQRDDDAYALASPTCYRT